MTQSVRPPLASIVTALTLIVLCIPAALAGTQIVRFRMAERSAGEDRAAAVRPWVSNVGLASHARIAALGVEIPFERSAAQKRTRELAAILSVVPVGSVYWMLLSSAMLTAEESQERVASAFMMSVITGPKEQDIMVQRGAFGLSLWESLPAQAQRHAAADVALTLRASSVFYHNRIRPMVSSKPPEVQEQIRSALLQAEDLTPAELAWLGL